MEYQGFERKLRVVSPEEPRNEQEPNPALIRVTVVQRTMVAGNLHIERYWGVVRRTDLEEAKKKRESEKGRKGICIFFEEEGKETIEWHDTAQGDVVGEKKPAKQSQVERKTNIFVPLEDIEQALAQGKTEVVIPRRNQGARF